MSSLGSASPHGSASPLSVSGGGWFGGSTPMSLGGSRRGAGSGRGSRRPGSRRPGSRRGSRRRGSRHRGGTSVRSVVGGVADYAGAAGGARGEGPPRKPSKSRKRKQSRKQTWF